jgi:hypothetical protein
MRDMDELFDGLARSKFRSGFKLGEKEYQYLNDKGIETIMEHACRFVVQRLSDAHPKNDGKQTPMRGHPVFIAQHATGTCCRSCLFRWHRIEKAKPLSEQQIQYIIEVIKRWLMMQTWI